MTEQKEDKILVVAQLPAQSINITEIDGEKVRLLTIEDAITKILEKINKIEKSVA